MGNSPVDRDKDHMKNLWGTTSLITDYWSLPHKTNDPEVVVASEQAEQLNKEELFSALKTLDDRSKDILNRRYLADNKATLHDLADEYEVSAERIRQIENAALKKLKTLMVDFE